MLRIRLLSAVFVSLVTISACLADTLELNPNHPTRYVVVKGDTLWDISARFLKDPWKWPEIWEINPEIENPHLIYPGDVITLEFENGRPVLRVSRGHPTVKLSPQIHSTPVQQAIPTIPLNAIQQFLTQPRVLSKEEADAAPYVVASEEDRLVSGQGNEVYARGISSPSSSAYTIVHIGKAYRSPRLKNKVLGYEAIEVAQAHLEKTGDPSTLRITKSKREVLVGDRLIPTSSQTMLDQNFVPHPPAQGVEGEIISVVDGVSRIGQFQIVVLALGTRNGVAAGNVFAVLQSGESVRDVVAHKGRVTLPDERAGTVLVFRSFDRLSYAMVMNAEKDMRVYDAVRSP